MSLLCSIPLAASLFSACAAPAPLAVGYVEGDYVLLAPVETAQVTKVLVRRGDRVETGEPVVALENSDSEIAVAQASAALAQAEAQLADLKIGKRPEEIAVLEAAVRSAHAQANEARRSAERTANLSRQGIATQAQLDEANTAVDVADAQIGALTGDEIDQYEMLLEISDTDFLPMVTGERPVPPDLDCAVLQKILASRRTVTS